jgi:hypothetical protein
VGKRHPLLRPLLRRPVRQGGCLRCRGSRARSAPLPVHPPARERRARALAKTGERRAAERAIGQALDLSDVHDVPVGLTSCISFEPYGRARTLANAVTSHVSLHDTSEVLRDAERIDDLVEHSDSSWSRALVRLDVSTALLHQHTADLDHAMALGREALRLCGDLPISSVYQRSRDLYGQAGPWRKHPAVREYGDELRTWSSQPAALAMSSS